VAVLGVLVQELPCMAVLGVPVQDLPVAMPAGLSQIFSLVCEREERKRKSAHNWRGERWRRGST
jgi:hypothetical protein